MSTRQIILLDSFGHTPKQISTQLNLTREHVGQTITQLRNEGRLRPRSNPLALFQRTSLEKIAGLHLTLQLLKGIQS